MERQSGCGRRTVASPRTADSLSTLPARLFRAKALNRCAIAYGARRLVRKHVNTGASICNRNRIMTGLRFLFRVTLRRLNLAAEIYHLREPVKIPLVMSPDETKRLLAVASSLKTLVLLSLGYGCGLRPAKWFG